MCGGQFWIFHCVAPATARHLIAHWLITGSSALSYTQWCSKNDGSALFGSLGVSLLTHLFLPQVLKETLRIYPPGPGTSRDVVEDMVIDGVHIPGGFTCIVSHLVFSVFGALKQGVCVRTQKCFILCLCFMCMKDSCTSLKNIRNKTFLEYL